MRTGFQWLMGLPTMMAPPDGGGGDASGGGGGGGGGDDNPPGGSASSSFAAGGGGGDDDDAGGGGGGAGGTLPDWANEFADTELKTWISKKSERWGEGGLEAAMKSHRELESFRGVDERQLIKMPGIEDREGWHGPGGVFERVGRPENAAGYKLMEVDLAEFPEGTLDLIAPFRDIAFDLGLTGHQATTLSDKMNEIMVEHGAKLEADFLVKKNQENKQVEGEWGDQHGPNMAIANKGAQALGFDPQTPAGQATLLELEKALGTRNIIMKMHEIGSRMSEHGGGDHGSGQGSTFMTPTRAQSEIERLEGDPAFMKAYLDGNAAENEKMTSLYQMANPS